MLVKPEIEDERIITCLQKEYGLRIIQLAFLPIGGDLGTAVYRAVEEDGTPFFCKLRLGDFDEISVTLPKFLSEQGIAQIIPPLITKTERLWAELDTYKLILYPFVEGTSGFDVELSQRQWADFGTALRRIHNTTAPVALSRKIQKERFSPERRDMCRSFINRLENETFDDPITLGLAEFLRPKREIFLDLIGRAKQLAHTLASRQTKFVLCHSDIHPGNLFIDKNGPLFIVDCDYPMLAPKERDLMFIGGGQGYVRITALEEEMLFYPNYGQASIDPVAMAYYRCERNLVDLSVECPHIFSSTLSDQERALSLEIITWLFLPGGSIEMAYKALERVSYEASS
jgi:spectinomycin phosphotransferase